MKSYLLLLSICFFIGCKSPEKDKSDDNDNNLIDKRNKSDKEKPETGHVSDTLFIDSGKDIVVGYSPSDAEYNALSKEEKSDMDEVVSDFNFYLGEVVDTFKINKIEFTITGARYIKIGRVTFDKKKFKDDVGIIMIKKNGENSVWEGVGTDTDFIAIIKKFYNIK